MKSLPLDGRAAIITGASEGLGREIARAYVRAGASVLICARDPARLEDARAEIASLTDSSRVAAIPADVSDPPAAENLVAIALDRFSRVQVLVNNAGVYGPMGPIESVDWQAWVKAVEITCMARC